jgi:hypothetical protein
MKQMEYMIDDTLKDLHLFGMPQRPYIWVLPNNMGKMLKCVNLGSKFLRRRVLTELH